jgi:hypothetical protein
MQGPSQRFQRARWHQGRGAAWHYASGLFFIGTGKTFVVKLAGTLFLGINDNAVRDNGGGFTVAVTGP